MFYIVMPFVILFKIISCAFIWIVSIKVPENELETSESCIIVPSDDKIAMFRFVARISGVACAYVWNSSNFA